MKNILLNKMNQQIHIRITILIVFKLIQILSELSSNNLFAGSLGARKGHVRDV